MAYRDIEGELEEAMLLLSYVVPADDGSHTATLALIRNYLQHGEPGLAHNELVLIGMEFRPGRGFWDRLTWAAEGMGLKRDAALCRRLRHEGEHGFVYVLFEILPRREGGLSATVADGGRVCFVPPEGGEARWATVYAEYGVPFRAGESGTARLLPSRWDLWEHLRPEAELAVMEGERRAGTVLVLEVRRGTLRSASAAYVEPRPRAVDSERPPARKARRTTAPAKQRAAAAAKRPARAHMNDWVRNGLLRGAQILPVEQRALFDSLLAAGHGLRAAEELLAFGCKHDLVNDRFWDALQDAYGGMQCLERNRLCIARREEVHRGVILATVQDGSAGAFGDRLFWDLGPGERELTRAYVQPRLWGGAPQLRILPEDDEWEPWVDVAPGQRLLCYTTDAGDSRERRVGAVIVVELRPPATL